MRLKRELSLRPTAVRAEWEARPAAVLVPLYSERDEWHVLYTLRTDTVNAHQGQVSFPGGRIDPADHSPAEAALREAQEEIGLPPHEVEVLGQLDPLLTVTQFLVTPVVGRIPWPYPLRPNPVEVREVFSVPLRWLLDPANLEVRQREAMIPGTQVSVYYFRPYHERVIWGVTARITVNLLEILRAMGKDKPDR
jgi:8-oxo-dGTP pyrophosphatase MutT (NUDIX family)